MEYQIPKGVFDILPQDPDPEGKWRESSLWQYIENIAKTTASDFGFREIRTPIFEKTSLFQRSIGQGTDIISKEMYTFEDKGGRSLSLRPEGTASVMRSFIEKNLYSTTSVHKYFYIGPVFRYERQQAGRYRQHHQFGVEAIGSESPLQDVEGIELLYTFLQRLGIKNTTLKINSIGSLETRKSYREALKNFLTPYFNDLSEDSKTRFEVNPLRILDSKDLNDKKIVESAPTILDFLDDESKAHFQSVCAYLKEIEIPFTIDTKLVRGLDYYNKTVFEITSEEIGAQNSLGGGGRYDGLLHQLGGPDLPAFGFGAGLERIIQTMLAQKVVFPLAAHPQLFLIPIGDVAVKFCFKLMSDLRRKGFGVEMDFTGKKLKHALRKADAINARFAAIVGDEELGSNTVELKEMKTGQTTKVAISNIENMITKG